MLKNILKLCLVTHPNPNIQFRQYIDKIIIPAVLGGVTMVQYRAKPPLRAQAIMLKKALAPLNIPIIINDDVKLAKDLELGVHLGENDACPIHTRQVLGPQAIIGMSIEHLHRIKISDQVSGPCYVTASALFPSSHKDNCKTIWGIDGLKTIIKSTKHPVTVIGGINLNNAKDAINAGAAGIAVIGAIHQSHPRQAAWALRHQIETYST